MTSRNRVLTAAIGLLVAAACGYADAQSNSRYNPLARPAGGGSGYANFELQNIRRRAIGNTYSIDAINRRSLNTARVTAPATGVGSVDSVTGRRQAASIGSGIGSTQTSRPFDNLSTRPTVSPYLRLFDNPIGGGTNIGDDFAYQTQVRPQIQQQQLNQQLQRQSQELNQRLQEMAARPAFNASGSQQMAPTGTPSTYRFRSHYYPGRR